MSPAGLRSDPRVAGGATVALAFVAFVCAAWLDDDAFVTFRAADNLLSGYGPRWNVVERVQAYSNPLWMGLHAALVWVTGHHELTSIALSLVLSTGTIALVVFRVGPSIEVGCIAAGTLLVSKAWVDYAGSGLEDPLTRVLLVGFVLVVPHREGGLRARDRVLPAGLLASAGALCRPDALLVFLPPLGALVHRAGRGRWWRLALGLSPLALWGAFATFYYGSPWPNTAYAKLGTGVPQPARIVQGLGYLLDSLVRDPATLGVLTLATVLACRHPRAVRLPVLAGGLLYLAWVVWIGGTYMSGRFLGLPLTAAVVAVLAGQRELRLVPGRRTVRVLFAVALACLGVRMAEPLVQKGVGIFAIGDERRTHHPYTGLLQVAAPGRWPEHFLRILGERMGREGGVHLSGAIGMMGFYAGPEVYLVDGFGLADPLLARLPGRVEHPYNTPLRSGWRPGHLARPLPDGYVASLPDGPNRIEDPELARFYDVIRTATRDPLWDSARLLTVVRLNLGCFDHLVDSFFVRNGGLFTSPSRTPGPVDRELSAAPPARRRPAWLCGS